MYFISLEVNSYKQHISWTLTLALATVLSFPLTVNSTNLIMYSSMCLCLKENNIFGTLCLWKDAKMFLPIAKNSEDTYHGEHEDRGQLEGNYRPQQRACGPLWQNGHIATAHRPVGWPLQAVAQACCTHVGCPQKASHPPRLYFCSTSFSLFPIVLSLGYERAPEL